MQMDPRHLRTLAVVVRRASFSGAARELGYTQSAVSQHVAALEADLGTTLVERRPVAPTEAGARLLEHAGAILLRLDAARADVIRVAAGPRGRLVVGATPLAAPAAAAVVAAARRARPALAATVRVAERDSVATAVATGELDAAVVDGVAAPGDPLPLPETGLPVAGAREAPSPSRSRPAIPSPAPAACGSRTSPTRAGSTRRRSARRSPPWRCSRAPTASAPPPATTAST